MSYPTVNFLVTSAEGGVQPIAQASGTPMHPLGKIVRAQDATYGEIEAVYLLGVASTAKGDAVCYRSDTGVTVRAVHGGATSVGSVAVAMSDCVAGQYGWYAISGAVPVNTGTVAANGQAYLTSTAGQLDDAVVSGDELGGFLFKSADSAGFATGQLSRPTMSGLGGSSGTNTGDVTLAAVGSTPAAAGASLAGQVLTLQPASATQPGVVTTGAQTLAGAKTLSGATVASGGFGSDVSPSSDEGFNLGSTTKRWAYTFTDGLKDNQGNIREGFASNDSNKYTDGVAAPGAASIAHDFNTIASYATAGGLLARFKNNGVAQSTISKDGAYGGTYTDTSGTPGSGTASTVTGRSAIAATSAAAITITNTLCLATSVVMATLESNDATCKSLAVVPGAGSFTVTPGASTTAITKFRWILFNGA